MVVSMVVQLVVLRVGLRVVEMAGTTGSQRAESTAAWRESKLVGSLVGQLAEPMAVLTATMLAESRVGQWVV